MNPAMLEDRSELFSEINSFSQRKLKKTKTKVATETPVKLDLQVGLILPGLMIGE